MCFVSRGRDGSGSVAGAFGGSKEGAIIGMYSTGWTFVR